MIKPTLRSLYGQAVLAATALVAFSAPSVQADEHFFATARGAETLPHGKSDLYQFFTLRTGKDSGTYRGWDSDTEYEYGISDQLTIGIAIEQHYFDVKDNVELGDIKGYEFGGVEVSGKYRVLSPFKDPIGLAFRLETGYLSHDDVGGFDQEEIYVTPQVILQKNFRDDTIILVANGSVQWAWGKQPAEEYNKEVSFDGVVAAAYRFAPNWYIGGEYRIRSEYPLFDLGFREHTVTFLGPAIHYASQKWWATLAWGYQVWGSGVDEPVDNKTYAEETRNEFRFKIGFNF